MMSNTWKTCFWCGFKKPPERLTTREIGKSRRTVCDNCAEDLDSGILVVKSYDANGHEIDPAAVACHVVDAEGGG